jgi:hypothetical protein
VDADGALDQSFFKPKKVVYVQEKVWGPTERDKLYEGLKTYGVGEWGKMKEHLLPKVRVCVCVCVCVCVHPRPSASASARACWRRTLQASSVSVPHGAGGALERHV